MHRRSIRHYILFNNIITIMIPIVVFGFWAIQLFVGQYEEDVVAKNQVITSSLAEQFATIQREPTELIKFVDQELVYSLDKDHHDMKHFLENLVKSYSYVLNIEVLDEDGIVIESGMEDDEDIGSNRTGEEFYSHFKDIKEGFYWTTPYMSATINQLTYSLNYRCAEGYYIIMYISLETLSKTSAEVIVEFGDDLQVAIVDAYGKYIVHADSDKVQFRLLDDNIEVIKEIAEGRLPYAEVVYENTNQVLTVAKMTQENWFVTVYQPSDSVFALMRRLMLFFFPLMILAGAISTIYAMKYSSKISSFVAKLQGSMDHARENDYQVTLPDFLYPDLNEVGSRFTTLMTDVKERDEKLLEMAYDDQLTGLKNRLYMTEYIEKTIQTDLEDALTLIQIDIDAFKLINDIYGHDVGDALLIRMGVELKAAFEGVEGIICRMGADEYSVLLKGAYTKDFVEDKLKKLKDKLTNGVIIETRLVRCDLTAGMANYPEQTINGKILTQYADIALVEAKEDLRGGVRVFDQSMREKIRKRTEMEQLLRTALKGNMYELYFQPQIKVEDGQIFGFEALVRMKDLKGKLIGPYHFIPIAEATGLIIDIGEWILEEAIKRIMKINKRYNSRYKMAVNISTVQMKAPGFVEKVLSIIETSGIDQSLLEFEVTESVFIKSGSEAFRTLQQLHDKGIQFAMDDFGTGYSSLSYLTNMPFKMLKIDRSFIADVETIEAKRRMLTSIIDMGHKQDFVIVAEGVETMEQRQICDDYGCDIIQGYLYSRPLPYNQLLTYIEKHLKNRGTIF